MRQVTDLESELGELIAMLPERAHRPSAARNVNVQHQANLSPLEGLAVFVTERVGTMGFFLIIFAWTVIWLGWNMFAPGDLRFDPFPAFVLWLFISNLVQIHLMPLIMVGQNLQGRHSERRAEADFEVNQKGEAEAEEILQRLEAQAQLIIKQGEVVLQILRRLDAMPTSAPHP